MTFAILPRASAEDQTPVRPTPDGCRPDLISLLALERRRERVWPRAELRAALAHVERQVVLDVSLWSGKAGATRRRLLEALIGLAQDRCSLEVEETLERLGALVGLQSAGTVGERIRELQAAGWLTRLGIGRKNHWGSVWRIEVPQRLCQGRPAQRPQAPVGPLPANRDIMKATSDRAPLPLVLSLTVQKESLTPRPAQPALASTPPSTPPPNPKSAPKEDLTATPTSVAPQRSAEPASPNNPNANGKARPRRSQVSRTGPTSTTVGRGVGGGVGCGGEGLPIWPAAEYGAMRAAVEAASAGAEPGERVMGQIRAVTRALLAGEFQPGDVRAVVGKVGRCSPLRLRAILEGHHVDLPPRQARGMPEGAARDLVQSLLGALPEMETGYRRESRAEVDARQEALAMQESANRAQRQLGEELADRRREELLARWLTRGRALESRPIGE